MRILFRERVPPQRRWRTLLEERVDGEGVLQPAPLLLTESSDLALLLDMESAPMPEARVRVGNFLVASSLEQDRPEFLLVPPLDDGTSADCLVCGGRLLRDWVGQTELKIEVLKGELWQPVLIVALSVLAGKIKQEDFEALCTDIANHSAAILLDVYGKTFVGLEPERRPGESTPVIVLQRLRQTLDQMAAALRAIGHQPAYRLKTSRVREPALAEQGVSDLTLEEACGDPSVVVSYAGRLHFRERVREVAAPHFDLPEHRLIAGFLHFLAVQIRDLSERIQREMDLRNERRAYRNRRGPDGGKTWWETEDLPRIEELHRLLGHLTALERELTQLRRHPVLPAAARLREVPASTPLIRSHRAYASAFKVIVSHFTSYRVRLDDEHLVLRAKSLPVLYEWWCVLEVLRLLQGCLRLRKSSAFTASSPFRRLDEERERFVIELTPDQVVDFEDEAGRLVRLRYVPTYRRPTEHSRSSYGLLGLEEERTPDVAVEVFRDGDANGQPPELIVILDAKYSSEPQPKKLEEVRYKYGKIGVFHTGRVLSRQVWALTPAPPLRGSAEPEWAAFCTVDNVGFWSEQFDVQSTVAGVVQAKPNMPPGRSPLESLLRSLLRRSGICLKSERD